MMSINIRNGPNLMTGVLIAKKKKKERERDTETVIQGEHNMTMEADTGLMPLGLLAGTRSQEEARCGPALGL